MGDIGDFSTFMGAVIDRNAFSTITGYIETGVLPGAAGRHIRFIRISAGTKPVVVGFVAGMKRENHQ